MTVAAAIKQRAFAVWWKDFGYWQVHSLRLSLTNKCNWPTVRLGEIAVIRSEIVSKNELAAGKVKLLDRISFDEGKVFFGKRTVTRMTQFRAKPGDLVVSKSNARKRAIGIIREGDGVGVTIHFRALVPDKERVNTEFLWAALRSPYCSQQFEVETGGIGKGEISEDRLLAINVPLPTLAEQRAIVTRWRNMQDAIAEATEKAEQAKTTIDTRFFSDLGLRSPAKVLRPSAFAVHWCDFFRGGVEFNFLNQSGADLSQGKYPVQPHKQQGVGRQVRRFSCERRIRLCVLPHPRASQPIKS